MKFFAVVTVIAVTAMSCASTKSTKTAKAYNPVVAHRGAFKKQGLPENSIASLREAIRLGCAGTEFDVHLTADDSLVLNHDATYNGLQIEKNTYATLSTTPLANGEPLPLLRNFITEGLQNNPGTTLVCEIKPSSVSKERGQVVAEKVYHLLDKFGINEQVIYISFDIDILKKLLSINPKLNTQFLEGNKSPAELKQLGIKGLDYHYSVFEKHPEWVAEAKKLGMALNAWTVNDGIKLDRFIADRFDFITTNEPELLFEKLRTKK